MQQRGWEFWHNCACARESQVTKNTHYVTPRLVSPQLRTHAPEKWKLEG